MTISRVVLAHNETKMIITLLYFAMDVILLYISVCGTFFSDTKDITECQGLEEIPEGDWFCDACKFKKKVRKGVVNIDVQEMQKDRPEPELLCCLCQQPGSAMKPTNKGDWVHVTCALWIPELSFNEDLTQVTMDGLTKKRSKLVSIILAQDRLP